MGAYGDVGSNADMYRIQKIGSTNL